MLSLQVCKQSSRLSSTPIHAHCHRRLSVVDTFLHLQAPCCNAQNPFLQPRHVAPKEAFNKSAHMGVMNSPVRVSKPVHSSDVNDSPCRFSGFKTVLLGSERTLVSPKHRDVSGMSMPRSFLFVIVYPRCTDDARM